MGSVITNFLASRAMDNYQHLYLQFFGKDLICISKVEEIVNCSSSWKMYFDDASNALNHGIRPILILLDGNYYLFTTRLNFDCTNNIAK